MGFEVEQRLSLGDVVDEDGEVEDAGGFDFHGEVGLHGVDAEFADVFDAGGSAGSDVVGLAGVFGFEGEEVCVDDVFDVDEVVGLFSAEDGGSLAFFDAFDEGADGAPVFAFSVDVAISQDDVGQVFAVEEDPVFRLFFR